MKVVRCDRCKVAEGPLGLRDIYGHIYVDLPDEWRTIGERDICKACLDEFFAGMVGENNVEEGPYR